MLIYFIRHGKTKGNLEKRYVGRTDESLDKNYLFKPSRNTYPSVDRVYTSEMKRSKETAKIFYPLVDKEAEKNLNEIDFGDFEYKNYKELKDNLHYQKFIDSGGSYPIPNGESIHNFKKRCLDGFVRCIKKAKEMNLESIAFVIHGGSIMSILEKFAKPSRNYFEWQVQNNCGFLFQLVYNNSDNLDTIILELVKDIDYGGCIGNE